MTPPAALVEAFEAYLRERIEAVAARVARLPSDPDLATVAAVQLDWVEGLRASLPTVAETQAAEAAELAELLIADDEVRAEVLDTAAAELAACWGWRTEKPIIDSAGPVPALWLLFGGRKAPASPEECRAAWAWYGPRLNAAVDEKLIAWSRRAPPEFPPVAAAVADDEVRERAAWVKAELAELMTGPWDRFYTLYQTMGPGRIVAAPLALAALYRAESAAGAGARAVQTARALVEALDPTPEIFAAIRAMLAMLADDRTDVPDVLAGAAADDSQRLAGWAAVLLVEARSVVEALGDVPMDEARAIAAARAADDLLVGRLGATVGAALAAAIAARPARAGGNAWSLWRPRMDEPARWLQWLARGLWTDRWRPEMEVATRTVALPLASLSRLGRILEVRSLEPGRDGRPMLVDKDGRTSAAMTLPPQVTTVRAEDLETFARAGVGQLQTLAAARFIAMFAEKVQRRTNERAPLVWEGESGGINAYGALAADLGLDPTRDATKARNLVSTLGSASISWPDGSEGSVMMWDYHPGGGRGRRSTLTLTPGRVWWSRDIEWLPAGADHRALAPIPHFEAYAPPMLGRSNERAAVARLWLRILAELAELAEELAKGNGAQIPGYRWATLANEVGVPCSLVPDPIQDRWTHDGDDGPAILERIGVDRWHLAPAFAAERTLLENGGRIRIGAGEGGRKSVRAKTARLLAGGGKKKPPPF